LETKKCEKELIIWRNKPLISGELLFMFIWRLIRKRVDVRKFEGEAMRLCWKIRKKVDVGK